MLAELDGQGLLTARLPSGEVMRLRAAIGRGGISGHKQEGDGATPAGTLPLRRVLFRADRVPAPACAAPRAPLAPDDGWCDDPGHPDYNRLIRLPHAARHEALWRDDALYDVIGVLGWNDAPVVPGRGSAIFLHIARPDGAPTDGCIALPRAEVLALLRAGLSGIRVV
jgi:L,D-peptidoglycan transpeptidase YkuD (ErfK/YbiS/YcfS/YnhG family)